MWFRHWFQPERKLPTEANIALIWQRKKENRGLKLYWICDCLTCRVRYSSLPYARRHWILPKDVPILCICFTTICASMFPGIGQFSMSQNMPTMPSRERIETSLYVNGESKYLSRNRLTQRLRALVTWTNCTAAHTTRVKENADLLTISSSSLSLSCRSNGCGRNKSGGICEGGDNMLHTEVCSRVVDRTSGDRSVDSSNAGVSLDCLRGFNSGLIAPLPAPSCLERCDSPNGRCGRVEARHDFKRFHEIVELVSLLCTLNSRSTGTWPSIREELRLLQAKKIWCGRIGTRLVGQYDLSRPCTRIGAMAMAPTHPLLTSLESPTLLRLGQVAIPRSSKGRALFFF